MANCCNNCPEYELDCAEVLDCVNADLLVLHVGENNPTMSNFCPAVVDCVDAQFEAVASGLSTSFDFYGASIVKILKSISGFSVVGDLYLSSQSGDLEWTSGTIGQTYLEVGTGLTLTGDGSSGNPYITSLDDTYVVSLFTADNGITKTATNFKLGGALVEDTTINGDSEAYTLSLTDLKDFNVASRDFSIISTFGPTVAEFSANTALQIVKVGLDTGTEQFGFELYGIAKELRVASTEKLILSDGNTALKTFFKIAEFGSASNGDVLALANNSTGAVEWITPASPAAAFTIEDAQDAIGSILVDSSTIDFTYTDATPSITASVIDDSITFAKIQNITSDRLLGRDTAASGDAEEITIGGGIEFTGTGAIRTTSFTGDVTKTAGGTVLTIASDAVTDDKLRDSAGFSVIGKTDSGAGDVADITAGIDTVLGRNGSGDLEFSTIVTNQIGTNQVTLSKIQNINTARILGRTTAGSGNVESLAVGSHMDLSAGVLNTYGRTLIGVSTYTTDDTWIKPGGCNAVIVLSVAGGGGGAGTSSAANCSVAGGGGSGSFRWSYIDSGLGVTEAVTIGAAGAGGVGAANGTDGGDTSFGAHTTVNGGLGGVTLAEGTSGNFAVGGVGGTPDATGVATEIYSGAGEAGRIGIRLSGTMGISGAGGSSIAGGPGDSYGSGGDGATAAIGADTNTGSDGTAGLIVVFEYS